MSKSGALSDLIRRASQALAAAYAKQEPDISLPQATVLRVLMQKGPLPQVRIRDALFMDKSTLSELLQRLATLKMVVNAKMESDKRSFLVTITPAGRIALVRVEGCISEAEARVLKLIPKGDRAAFRRSLAAIADGKAQ